MARWDVRPERMFKDYELRFSGLKWTGSSMSIELVTARTPLIRTIEPLSDVGVAALPVLIDTLLDPSVG